jgi:predicted GNAT superfamily acetyltransferase
VSSHGMSGGRWAGCDASATLAAMREIRRAQREDLPGAAALLAGALRFGAADAIPAWLMRTTDECGGLTLVAAAGDAVVGVSYAFPARDGELFSCGLAVAADHRGQGLGRDLKAAQRREAIALGYRAIRWTTDPLNVAALRLYLSKLGALVVGYRAGLHDGLRADPGHPQDDLDVVWHLGRRPALDRHGVRRVTLADRGKVRDEMSALLADGFVGCGVEAGQMAFARLRR